MTSVRNRKQNNDINIPNEDIHADRGSEDRMTINAASITDAHLDSIMNITNMLFVHLGKTGGSAITCMMSTSVQHSGMGNSGCDDTSSHKIIQAPPPSPSVISQKVSQRIHLSSANYDDENDKKDEYDAFLLTTRNPIDRIISWFYYVHPSYPPIKKSHHVAGCDNFSIYHCYQDMQSLSEHGLRRNSMTQNVSIVHDVVKEEEKCRSLAWNVIRGVQKCWHNYYNYNYTYGNLVQRMEEEMKMEQMGSTVETEMESEEVTSRSTRKKKYIFVIRSEHALQDWNTVDIMLGGKGTTHEMPLKNTFSSNTYHRKKTKTATATAARSSWGFEPKNVPNKTLSEIGRNNLCHALCEEIQIYKRVLSLAVNMKVNDDLLYKKDDSLDELLMTCPNEIRAVRRCDDK